MSNNSDVRLPDGIWTTETVPGPVRVFNGIGRELHKCVYVNTLTGLVVRLVYKNDQPVLNSKGDEVRRYCSHFPTPVKVYLSAGYCHVKKKHRPYGF